MPKKPKPPKASPSTGDITNSTIVTGKNTGVIIGGTQDARLTAFIDKLLETELTKLETNFNTTKE